MIKLDEQLDKEIQLYYKISVFVNKYILVLGSFIISILVLFMLNSTSSKVLAYTSSDINKKLKIFTNISNGLKTNNFNKKSKYIKGIVFLDKKTKALRGETKLGYGIFVGNGFYFPSNISLNHNSYRRYILSKDSVGYIKLLSASSINSKKLFFKKPSVSILKDDDVIKQYNLNCIDTFLSTSSFCDYNKKHLIQDLLKQHKDISSKMYDKIFSTLSSSSKEKCDILVGIYFNKFNYKNIKELLDKYCTDDISNKIQLTYEVSKFLERNNLYGSYKFENSSAYLIQLVNQEYDLIHSHVLQNENVLSYLNLLRVMINHGNIDRKSAINSYYFIKKYIQGKVSGLDDKINGILNGDKSIGDKGLISIINDKHLLSKLLKNDGTYFVKTVKTVRSKLEEFNGIVSENYNKDLLIVDNKYNSKTNKIYVKANIILSFKKSNQIIKEPVTIRFYVTKIYSDSFNVRGLYFEDSKIRKYLKKLVKRNYNSLDDLKLDLQKYLEAPLVYNDWTKDFSSDDVDICKKYNFIYKGSSKCLNGKVTFTDSDINIAPLKGIKIDFYLNNDLNVTKVLIKPIKKEFVLREYFDEKISIDFTKYQKYINNKLKNPKSVLVTKDFVSKVIKKAFYDTIKSKVGLSSEKLTLLETRFKKFLDSDVTMVRHYKGNYYIVYFRLNGKQFKSIYDFSKNSIRYVYIYDDRIKKFFLFRNVNIKLSSINQTILNSFTSDPLSYLKAKFPDEYKKYEKEINKK